MIDGLIGADNSATALVPTLTPGNPTTLSASRSIVGANGAGWTLWAGTFNRRVATSPSFSATAISPLVAGGAVPAASPLTTWAHWAGAPFNKYVFNYSNGTTLAVLT